MSIHAIASMIKFFHMSAPVVIKPVLSHRVFMDSTKENEEKDVNISTILTSEGYAIVHSNAPVSTLAPSFTQ